jgi:hypothetical protein
MVFVLQTGEDELVGDVRFFEHKREIHHRDTENTELF